VLHLSVLIDLTLAAFSLTTPRTFAVAGRFDRRRPLVSSPSVGATPPRNPPSAPAATPLFPLLAPQTNPSRLQFRLSPTDSGAAAVRRGSAEPHLPAPSSAAPPVLKRARPRTCASLTTAPRHGAACRLRHRRRPERLCHEFLPRLPVATRLAPSGACGHMRP
jgi:hypothetical protein